MPEGGLGSRRSIRGRNSHPGSHIEAIRGRPTVLEDTMSALFAYSFPLLSLIWAMLIFAGIFLMIFFIVWSSSTISADTITTAWRRQGGRS